MFLFVLFRGHFPSEFRVIKNKQTKRLDTVFLRRLMMPLMRRTNDKQNFITGFERQPTMSEKVVCDEVDETVNRNAQAYREGD